MKIHIYSTGMYILYIVNKMNGYNLNEFGKITEVY